MTRLAPLLLLVLSVLLPACSERSPEPQVLKMADEAFSRGEYLASERLYESFLQDHSDDEGRWKAWNRLLTISRTIRKSTSRSTQLLEAMHLEFIEDQDRLWEVLLLLGEEYRVQREHEKASAVYQKALEIPERRVEEYLEVRFLLFESQKKSGSFDLARTVLHDGLEMEVEPEKRAWMLLELSYLSMYAQELDEARAKLEEILAMDLVESETRVLAVFALGDLAEQQGEYEQARELFGSIVHAHPNPAAVRSRMNSLDKTLGRIPQE
jgi:tetratricopeptide (TPR) repeat protein